MSTPSAAPAPAPAPADALPLTCLCLLTRSTGEASEVLLGLKRVGFGQGRVVAPGGHVEPGETPPVAVAREVLEETGLIVPPDALRPLGSVEFRFPHRREWEQVTHVFGAEKWSGQQQDSRELLLSWHRLHELPLRQMWDDARFWLPLMLAGQRLHARFTFAADCATVTEAVLRPELG